MSEVGWVQAIPQQKTLRGWQWTTAVAGVLSVMIAMAPASRQATTTVIESTGKLEHMIVRAVPGRMHDAEKLVAKAGGTVGRELSIISGFAATVPADAVSGLRNVAHVVSSVEADAPMKPLSIDPVLGYDATGDLGSMANVTKLVGAQALWAGGSTGKGVGVALLDTGVAPVEGLTGQVIDGPDLSIDYQNGLAESVDAYGHGTHMAGIIAGHDAGTTLTDPTKFVGVAPDARIVNVKVGAADGSTDVSQVIAGIDWVVKHRNDNGLNIKVLNLSFGTLSKQAYTVDPLAYAAEVAWRKGVVVVAAAGNDGPLVKQLSNPAYNPRILAVGAADPKDSTQVPSWQPADFNNAAGTTKRSADVFAPGMHIVSLRDPGSYVDTNFPASQVGTRFTRGSGSSQAAAVTSGLVADLFQKFPDATPDQMKNLLVKTDTPFKASILTSLLGLDKEIGTINGQKAMGGKELTSDHNGRQDFTYADGTGSLELSRGDMHLSNATSVLTGEQDIFGNAWNPQAWAAAAMNETSWDGGLWNGQRWSGDGWSGQRWSNATWTSNDWSGQCWSGQRWSGLIWDGQRWSGQRWSDASWSGQRWSDAGWDGQRWSGQRWSNTLWE